MCMRIYKSSIIIHSTTQTPVSEQLLYSYLSTCFATRCRSTPRYSPLYHLADLLFSTLQCCESIYPNGIRLPTVCKRRGGNRFVRFYRVNHLCPKPSPQ